MSCLDIRRQMFYIILTIKYEFDEQKSIGTEAIWGVYLWLNEEIEHDVKVTLTPEMW